MKHINLYTVAFIIPMILLSGCSDNKEPLKGVRESVLANENVGGTASTDESPITVDSEIANAAFSQPHFNSAHYYPPLKLDLKNLQQKWSANVDYEATEGLKFTSAPIIAEGKAFCIDAGGVVYAFDAENGNLLWRKSVTLDGKDGQTGTALAYEKDHLIVSTCFAECFSLNPTNGNINWRVKLPSASKGDAITIYDGKVFLLCSNSTLRVLNISDGRTLWTHSGITSDSIYLGSASVAIDAGIVYLAYPSGEIFALVADNGTVVWEASFPKFSVSSAAHAFVHPKASPIVKDGIVYFVAPNEQTLALDAKTGNRLWIKDYGSVQTPIVSGNSIFVFNNGSELVCLNRFNGALRWKTKLDSSRKYNWYGLALTKDHIIALSPEGNMQFVSVKNGKIERTEVVGGSVSVNPVIANSTLYILNSEGTLAAYK